MAVPASAASENPRDDSSSTDSRAQGILQGLARILRHDLPNQLVVLQGLVYLLELEESERLSPQAREYLTRMKNVSDRTLNLSGYLKDFFQLAKSRESAGSVVLVNLFTELQAQIRQSHPDLTLTWQTSWQVSELQAGRHSLLRALVELLRLAFSLSSGRSFAILLQAWCDGSGAHLRMQVKPGEPAPAPGEPKSWETQVEYLLARELLASWGGTLHVNPLPASFARQVPSPSATAAAAPLVDFVLGFPG